MKKLAIIGVGNAAVVSCMYFLKYTDFEISIYYDENKKPLDVGQGSIPPVTDLFEHFFDFYELSKHCDVTVKKGVLYNNWLKKKPEYFHSFRPALSSHHLNMSKLRDYFFQKFSDDIKLISGKITSYDQIDADFIIDCSGYSEDNQIKYTKLINPINKCGIYEEDISYSGYTSANAVSNGWIFKIPLLDKTSCGYLFNDKYPPANRNFSKIINIHNYVADNCIINDRVALNGNKYFFLEPLEATALYEYEIVSRVIHDFINDGANDHNEILYKHVKQLESFIGLHYLNADFHNTDFWKYAKGITKEIDYSELKGYVSTTKDNEGAPFGQWPLSSLEPWL